VADEPGGNVSYAESALRITLAEDGASMWSSRALPEPAPVVRIEASVIVNSGDGAVGLMCGTGGDTPEFLLGAVTTLNTWRLATLIDGATTTIAEGPLPPQIDMGGGGSADLAVECAVTGTDAGDRIALWVDGQVVGDATAGSALGAWERVALAASVVQPALVAFFDDAVVDVGDSYAPAETDQAVLDLLARIPPAWHDGCTARRPVGGEGIVAGLVCAPAGSADQAEYYRYATPEALAAAYADLVAGSGQVLDRADCATGPSDITWSVPGESSGQVACFENRDTLGGLVIVWTDAKESILALGVRSSGGYPELYDWWLGTGPEA
jgi:hypothetical protein